MEYSMPVERSQQCLIMVINAPEHEAQIQTRTLVQNQIPTLVQTQIQIPTPDLVVLMVSEMGMKQELTVDDHVLLVVAQRRLQVTDEGKVPVLNLLQPPVHLCL
jgi:hypothetical protein